MDISRRAFLGGAVVTTVVLGSGVSALAATNKPSALAMVDIGRVAVMIEKFVENTWMEIAYGEINDEVCRAGVSKFYSGYLDMLTERGAITSHFVQCDGSNNTPALIDDHKQAMTILFHAPNTMKIVRMDFVLATGGLVLEDMGVS